MTDDNRPYCRVWKQHLTRYSTPHRSASHAHRLIYMIKALFNTSARSLMSQSPENTSAPYESFTSPFSLVPVCLSVATMTTLFLVFAPKTMALNYQSITN